MMILTHDFCAKEYARLQYPENEAEKQELIKEGEVVFSDLAQMCVSKRLTVREIKKMSADVFSDLIVKPEVVKKIKPYW